MVFCVRKFNGSLQKEHKMIKSRRMNNFNEQAFLEDVAAISWEQEIGNSDDVNVLANNWSNLFSRPVSQSELKSSFVIYKGGNSQYPEQLPRRANKL